MEDDDLTQLPLPDDAMLFNDSLDEEGMADSFLELANEAKLPTECAAGEEKEEEEGNPVHLAGEAQQDLDDSLNVEEVNGADQHIDVDIVCNGGSETVAAEEQVKVPTSQTCGEKASDCSSQERQSSLAEAKSSPRDNSSLSTTGATSKVKPSFGKKKKGFSPPAVTEKMASLPDVSKEPPNQSNSSTTPQQTNCGASDSSEDRAMPATTLPGLCEEKEKVSDKKAPQEQRKNSKGEKGDEVAVKKQNREQKKIEKEKKKAELERQREEKRLELERKKAEREQKKMEKELKKIEREQKKAEKQAMASKKKEKKNVKGTSNTNSKEERNEEDGHSRNDTELTPTPLADDEGSSNALGSTDNLPCQPTATDSSQPAASGSERDQDDTSNVEQAHLQCYDGVDQDLPASKSEIPSDRHVDSQEASSNTACSGELTSQDRSTEDTKTGLKEKPASTATKVKPSFGKKKGFTPPNTSKNVSTSSPSHSSKEGGNGTSTATVAKSKNAEKSASSSVNGADHNGAQKREQKKIEKERKKAELERQREEKRLELERKKAEREQKKMEKELKKIEREQKKAEKQAMASKKKENGKTHTASGKEELVSENVVDESSDKERVEHESEVSGQTVSEVKGEDGEKTVSEEDKENTAPDSKQLRVSDDYVIDDKIPIVVVGPVPGHHTTETKEDETKLLKEKKAKFTPPKMVGEDLSNRSNKRQRKRRETKGGEEESKARPTGKGKKRKASHESGDCDGEPEAKQSKQANYHGPVWVQCEITSCKKWRLLLDCDDPADVPGRWTCSMNADPNHNSCSAEEEQWSDLGDSQEFVESPYIPGSVVWSKMDGYPWSVSRKYVVVSIILF